MSGEVPPELGGILSQWLERLVVGGKRLNGCVPRSLRDQLELSESALASIPVCGAESMEEGLSQTVSGRDALVALFFATGGRNWHNSQLWLSARPIGEWRGVTVDEKGRVTHLELTENNLNGEIPPELGSLSNLQSLELGDNKLSGKIPPELGSLSNLQMLYLWGNELSGDIPPELGFLLNLQSLYLSGNLLRGAIPSELAGLLRLQNLVLSKNQLSGEIPRELGNLDFLRRLSLEENGLTGKIPPELGNLVHLQVLSLYENRLNGKLPAELSKLLNLTYLRLEGNRLTGCVPGHWQGQLGEHSDLGSFQFCDTASVPQSSAPLLSDRYALVEFHYATQGRRWRNNSNWLSGKPLDEWHGVTTDENGRVTGLSLANNGVHGDFSPEIGYLTSLEKLDLSHNRIKGEVPGGLGGLTDLKYLSLRDTNLRGCIPSTLSTQLNMPQSDLGGLPFCE